MVLICDTKEIADAIHAEIETIRNSKNTEARCSLHLSYTEVVSYENDERCTILVPRSDYLPSDAGTREGVTLADSVPIDLLNAGQY